jgi:hypothetical protein
MRSFVSTCLLAIIVHYAKHLLLFLLLILGAMSKRNAPREM